jgi:hypothetical protein
VRFCGLVIEASTAVGRRSFRNVAPGDDIGRRRRADFGAASPGHAGLQYFDVMDFAVSGLGGL